MELPLKCILSPQVTYARDRNMRLLLRDQLLFECLSCHKVYLPFSWFQKFQKLSNFYFSFIKVIGNRSLVLSTFKGKMKLHEKLMLFSVPY